MFCHPKFLVPILSTIFILRSLFSKLDILLLIAVVSLGIEGFVVFILNNGDCPLVHIQKRIGDNTPFFSLFFPANLAKVGIALITLVTGLTALEVLSENPLAVISGVCAIVLARNTVVNFRTERRLHKRARYR